MSTIKPIMINAGIPVLCIKSIVIGGVLFFKEGEYYKGSKNNCLINEFNEENFITHNNLKYFDCNEPE